MTRFSVHESASTAPCIGFNTGDPASARNDQELCLSADIISFELHALEALRRSGDPAIPLTRLLRLRSSAVSLSREAHRCRQKLQQMQAAASTLVPEHAVEPAPAAEPSPAQVRAEAAVELVEEARKIITSAGRQAKQGRYGGLTYSQALSKRMMANRIMVNQKRRAAENAAQRSSTGSDAALPAL